MLDMKYDKQNHTKLLIALNNANKAMTEARLALTAYEDRHGIQPVDRLGR